MSCILLRGAHLTHVGAERAARARGPITCSRTCNNPPCSIYSRRGNVGKAADLGTGVRVCACRALCHRRDRNGPLARAHVFMRLQLVPGRLPLPVTAGRPEFRGPLPDTRRGLVFSRGISVRSQCTVSRRASYASGARAILLLRACPSAR